MWKCNLLEFEEGLFILLSKRYWIQDRLCSVVVQFCHRFTPKMWCNGQTTLVIPFLFLFPKLIAFDQHSLTQKASDENAFVYHEVFIRSKDKLSSLLHNLLELNFQLIICNTCKETEDICFVIWLVKSKLEPRWIEFWKQSEFTLF